MADADQITAIQYRDLTGHLLWTTPMIFSRLHAVGDEVIWERQPWIVRRVAVADHVQHVNLAPGSRGSHAL